MNLLQLSPAKKTLVACCTILCAAFGLVGMETAYADNLQVYLSRPYVSAPDSSFVRGDQTALSGQGFAGGSAVPEPRSVALIIACLLPILGVARQRICQAAKNGH